MISALLLLAFGWSLGSQWNSDPFTCTAVACKVYYFWFRNYCTGDCE